jgi:hypothetical protein
MNDLERLLSECRPSTTGLDADRALFAAGRASARRGWGRFVWPVVCGCLALLAAALGVGLAEEHAARLEVTAQFHPLPAVAPSQSSAPEPGETPSVEPPAAGSYLSARRALSDNLDAWLAKAAPSEGPPSPTPPVWKAGSRADVFEP